MEFMRSLAVSSFDIMIKSGAWYVITLLRLAIEMGIVDIICRDVKSHPRFVLMIADDSAAKPFGPINSLG
jgi:presenilin-like A22 family membrane protease